MAIRCRNCGAKVQPEARFCVKCGSPTSVSSIEPPSPKPLEPPIQSVQPSGQPAAESWQRKNHLKEQHIPKGFQIFEQRLEVAGVGYRKEEAASFSKESFNKDVIVWLELEREETNIHDKNAIRIIGCCAGRTFGIKHRFIGYVPKDVASRIIEKGFWRQVRARLEMTYLGWDGFTTIGFQILGPEGRIKDYQDSP